MLKFKYRIRIEKRIDDTNKFNELIRVHVNPMIWRKILMKVNEKEEILTRTEFGKRIVNHIINHIERDNV